ncbi:unnamed protein product [Leptosia nina]|uniref:Transmembrane protein 231 n=1 Tax=Leptosia nina TaxID=320188 RepID=A0AAV1JMZ4_9NEOP
MLFTLITSILNVILPFLIAHRSRGFWLNSHYFYEQPAVRPTFEYLLVGDTEDPYHTVICGSGNNLTKEFENQCREIQLQEYDPNNDGKTDVINFKIKLDLVENHTITSIILILGLDFHLMTICPLQMQTFALVSKEFNNPTSGVKYNAYLELVQTSHLSCLRHHLDSKYNISLLANTDFSEEQAIDIMINSYFMREVTTQVKPYFVRSQHGYTGTMKIDLFLKIPEMKILYTPSFLQEVKWAWPQYLSLAITFYWIFNRIKRFVFNNRLLMAWEIIPWKKIP